MRYEDISKYVANLVGSGDELQKRVLKQSIQLGDEGVFPIDPTRGRLLELLARLRSPKRVLEIGSGAGYSALWFVKGMGPEGILEAIEVNPKVAKVLRGVIEMGGLAKRVIIHQGAAMEILRTLQGPYDFVFIDADKDEYPDYLDEAFRLTQTGSMIMADNMLWGGAVLGGKAGEGLKGIREYTDRIFHDPRLVSLIVPLGDGMAISYRV